MELNTFIVGIYFLFLIAIGWMFRTFTSTTSDYFRGGGNMLWWMVGATAFMTNSVPGPLPGQRVKHIQMALLLRSSSSQTHLVI